MKRCSTCNRTYTDPNLSFCIDDGTPLTTVPSENESTVVTPGGSETGAENDWNAPYRPPGSYVPPGGEVKRRRVWPWVVGIGGAFILGIVAISIAAAILAPRLLRGPEPRITVETRNSNQSENTNQSANSNVDESNTNSDANVDADAPPPTDHAQVLAQLTEMENEWTVANLNADKSKLDRILADDYIGQGREGGLETKADYIRTIQRDTLVEKWEFSDLNLLLAGDRATLSGKITYVRRGEELEFDFKDKFVWRDARWQATGSEATSKE